MRTMDERLDALETELETLRQWCNKRVMNADAQYKQSQEEYLRIVQTYVQHITTTPRLTLKEDVAVRLRVPESGTAWIDAMIVRSRELEHEDD